MTGLEVSLDIAALRDELSGGRLQPLELGELHVGAGALDRLGDLVAAACRQATVVAFAAATPITAAGSALRDEVESRLASRYALRWVELGPADGSVHADEPTVAIARQAAADAGCVIAAGSGTICDIAKAAAPGGVPLLVVQTATSVNGFADPFSVLLKSGVKRTTPTRWPDALIADTGVLTEAPDRLKLAGVGDMAAMFTSTADWYLATLAGADGPPYDDAVAGLVRPYGEPMLAAGHGIAADASQLAALARLLTLSGIAMGVTGSTAPASGMEHAVSHLLEMADTAHGEPASQPNLHGANHHGANHHGANHHGANYHGEQVGVASIVAAATWAHVRDLIAGGALGRAARLPDPDAIADRITGAFAALDPSGAMAAECLADYAVKVKLLAAAGDPIAALRDAWDECDAAVGRILTGPRELAAGLHAAGLPVRFTDLHVPVGDGQAAWAVATCALQRRRFGVADLAMLIGAWEDDDVAAVLAAAESAAAEAEGKP